MVLSTMFLDLYTIKNGQWIITSHI
jgi:hypothetical protein